MSYTCRACGEQATLTACEHCGGQGRSQSAIAEIARLCAELDTVTRERDGIAGNYSKVLLHITSGQCGLPSTCPDAAIALSYDRENEDMAALERERDEARALLTARDTAIVELRAALECCERNDKSEPYAYAGEESKRPSDGAQCEHRWQRWQTPREIARAALANTEHLAKGAKRHA